MNTFLRNVLAVEDGEEQVLYGSERGIEHA